MPLSNRHAIPIVSALLLALMPIHSEAQSAIGVRRAGAEASAGREGAPFELGKWYVGPRYWAASGWGTNGWGVQLERGWRQAGDGESALGFGASIDRFAQAGSYRVMTLAGFVNYHFGMSEESALDPFVGLGLGYTNVSLSALDVSYSSGFLFNPRAGVRWFLTPSLAVQGDVGYGVGYAGLGAAVKF